MKPKLQPVRSNEEAWQMVMANDKLVSWGIKKTLSRRGIIRWNRQIGNRDDAIQVARLGLFRACQLWNGSTRLSTYGYYWISSAILKSLEMSLVKCGRTVSEHSPGYEAFRMRLRPPVELPKEGLIDTFQDPLEHNEWLSSQVAKVNSTIELLEARQAMILSMSLAGTPFRQIGAEFGITRERARQIRDRARNNVRELMGS